MSTFSVLALSLAMVALSNYGVSGVDLSTDLQPPKADAPNYWNTVGQGQELPDQSGGPGSTYDMNGQSLGQQNGSVTSVVDRRKRQAPVDGQEEGPVQSATNSPTIRNRRKRQAPADGQKQNPALPASENNVIRNRRKRQALSNGQGDGLSTDFQPPKAEAPNYWNTVGQGQELPNQSGGIGSTYDMNGQSLGQQNGSVTSVVDRRKRQAPVDGQEEGPVQSATNSPTIRNRRKRQAPADGQKQNPALPASENNVIRNRRKRQALSNGQGDGLSTDFQPPKAEAPNYWNTVGQGQELPNQSGGIGSTYDMNGQSFGQQNGPVTSVVNRRKRQAPADGQQNDPASQARTEVEDRQKHPTIYQWKDQEEGEKCDVENKVRGIRQTNCRTFATCLEKVKTIKITECPPSYTWSDTDGRCKYGTGCDHKKGSE